MNTFTFTLWDVGHGLAIWINTPSGHNHWIDAGKEGDFSPSFHAASAYGLDDVDFQIISHPDDDHINDLANLANSLGLPRVLLRNRTLPDEVKFKSGRLDQQKVLQYLDTVYIENVPWIESPQNPLFNGGVEITTRMLTWDEAGQNVNNSSIVAFYLFQGWLFVMPGDIEESGWVKLWAKHGPEFSDLIARSKVRVLVAPHHGRDSGYSPSMFDCIKPHLTLISDKKAKAPTCDSFRKRPLGLMHNPYSGSLKTLGQEFAERSYAGRRSLIGMELGFATGTRHLLLERIRKNGEFATSETMQFISTKSQGRVQFRIDQYGNCTLHIVEK